MNRRPVMWRLLTNRQRFGPYLIGAFLSNAGTWCQNVAAVILVHRLTGDVFHVALVSVVQYGTAVLVGPYAGVAADRFDRRRLLALCQVGGILASLALAGAIWGGFVNVPVVLVGICLLGFFTSLQSPAQLAITPALVEPSERDLGLSWNATQFNLARCRPCHCERAP